MAGEPKLTTLPLELLSTILSYLTLKDTFSLLRTCKSLHPVAHRQLWSVLHLCDRIPQKYRGPPCPPFVHNPDNALGNDGCRRLAKVIKEKGTERLGFGSVRGLVLEPEMFSRSTVRGGLVKVIADEIEEGRMRLGWVKVSIWSSYLETFETPPDGIERFLKIIKAYSETRSPNEFSFILDTNFITSISPWYRPKSTLFDLIDLEKLTSLDLQLDIFYEEDEDEADIIAEEDELDALGHHDDIESHHGSDLDALDRGGGLDDDGLDAEGEPAPPTTSTAIDTAVANGTLGSQIVDLTRLLTSTVNLVHLKLAADTEDRGYTPPPIEDIASLLNSLQRAFNGLKKLRWLSLHGPIFHPSFFITPPENVRKLRIRCDVSVSWWRRFARCEFKNVEKLVIGHHFMMRGSWMSSIDEDDYKPMDEDGMMLGTPYPFQIGDVAVTGLKRFWADGMFGPQDLMECIHRRNLGLEGNNVAGLET